MMKGIILISLFLFSSCNPLERKVQISSSYQSGFKLNSVSPGQGPKSGGTRLMLTGNYFKAGINVKVGGLPCAGLIFVSKTAIECTTSPHLPSLVNIELENVDGEKTALNRAYTYLDVVGGAVNTGITLGGDVTSDLDSKMHSTVGETASGPVSSNAEATLYSGLQGSINSP